MKFVTYQQYLEYLKNNSVIKLKEKDVTYKVLKLEKTYNKEKIKEIDKKHDKMFRNILSRKKEMVKFLNQFLNLKEKIKEKQIIPCQTNFVTKQYKEKHSDIIYKLKDKPVYFLIEHQSIINQDMSLRIWEYVGEIMRKESITQKTYLRKNKVYPVVVPIVIYTGFQKWSAKTNFAERQYQSLNYKNYEISLEYNLIAIQDYTFEELLEKKSLLASIMILEKCRESEELIVQIKRSIEIIKNPKDREALAEIIINLIAFRVGQEKENEMLEKIKGKGEIGMSPLTKMLFDLERKTNY